MRQLTVRGISIELHHALRSRAGDRDLSINRYVLAILQRAVGQTGGRHQTEVEFHDLDHLAGTWTQQELGDFEKHLVAQRPVDEELWR